MGGGCRDDWYGPSMKLAVAGMAMPFALVLAIGAAWAPPSGPSAPGGAPFPSDLPAAAQPFTGRSASCSVPDPTGTGGCVTPATAWLLNELGRAFGAMPTSCWDEHAWNPSSDHPRGRGCDITFGRLGDFPDEPDADRGWLVATWLQANAAALRVRYLIWQGRIWHAGRAAAGWLPYGGGGVYDPSDPTGGHYDHIHVSTST
jgi:hypothetical protein